MFSHDRAAFQKAADSGANLIPLAQSWPADLETPLTTWIKVGAGRPPGVLLESVEGGETLGRWSVIACDPLWTASARGDRLTRRWRDGASDVHQGNPLTACVTACLRTGARICLGCLHWDSFTACGATS